MKRIPTMCGRRQTADGRLACRQARRPTADGFTLIEMLAALALAMILLYMLFQIFTTASRAMTTSNARSEIHSNARAILRIMHQEISGAFLDTSQDADSPDTDADYFIITDSTWSPPTDYPADFLQFLTSSALGTDGALSEVGYWLDTSDATLRRRLASDPTNYDSDPGTDYTSFDASDTGHKVLDMDDDGDIEPSELPTTNAAELATILGENVLAFNVEYYNVALLTDGIDNDSDGETDEPDEAWVDGADYTAQEKTATAAIPFPGLTPAVRITLCVRDRRGRIAEGEEFVEIMHIKGRE